MKITGMIFYLGILSADDVAMNDLLSYFLRTLNSFFPAGESISGISGKIWNPEGSRGVKFFAERCLGVPRWQIAT